MNALQRKLHWLGHQTLFTAAAWLIRGITGLAALAGAWFAWKDFRGDETKHVIGIDDWSFWVLVIIAVLVWWDPGTRLQNLGRHTTLSAQASMNCEAAFQSARPDLAVKSPVNASFTKTWYHLLLAADTELRLHLGRDGAGIKTNLLLVISETEIQVEARSQPGSPTPKKYTIRSKTAAGRAMQENKTWVSNDIGTNEDRPYRAVAATPIAHAGKVYGALTVDSPNPHAFKRHKDAIDQVFRRHAEFILITLKPKAPSLPCPDVHRR